MLGFTCVSAIFSMSWHASCQNFAFPQSEIPTVYSRALGLNRSGASWKASGINPACFFKASVLLCVEILAETQRNLYSTYPRLRCQQWQILSFNSTKRLDRCQILLWLCSWISTLRSLEANSGTERVMTFKTNTCRHKDNDKAHRQLLKHSKILMW